MPLNALNDDKTGNPVDWWFAYKLPAINSGNKKAAEALGEARGTEYLYCDAASSGLPRTLSPNQKILESGALVNTLRQLRDAAARKDPQVGWFFYNDEYSKTGTTPAAQKAPPNKANKGEYGHSKGVLAFDLGTNTAFWLLHSWPCFPFITPLNPPLANNPPSPLKGQSYLCITLKDVATADAIAKVFHEQSQPQIIEMSMPDGLAATAYHNLAQLAKDAPPGKVPTGAIAPSDTTFLSKNGATFRLFAKSKDWFDPATDKVQQPKDLYSDLIGPKLGVDLDVETWETGGESDKDSDGAHLTENIQWIDLREGLGLPFAWHYEHLDHAKWAVAKDPDTNDETDWVIVADINRKDSQYKRGGVGIAFQNRTLARSLHRIIKMVPPPEDEAVIEAAAARAAAARAKKAAAKTSTAKTSTANKSTAKTPASRNTEAKKPAARKTAARKTTASKSLTHTGKTKRR